MMDSDCKDTKFPHLESAAKVIIEFKSSLGLQQLINDGDRNKFDEYLYAVDKIQQTIKSGTFPGYETQGTLAMTTLQMVFQGILDCSIGRTTTNSEALNSTVYSSSVSSSYGYELQGSDYTGHGELSSEQVYRLHSIVKRLNYAECRRDCIAVYKISRRTAVVARFLRFDIGDLQFCCREEFAEKIKLWIQAANNCYKSIFPGERQYYEQIFHGVRGVTYDNCFLPIVELVAAELNNIANVSPFASFQNLFAVLDLYKAMLVILPDIQNMFHCVSSAHISSGASNNISSLETLVRKLFFSFQDVVLNESSNNLSPKGAVHYMTKYTVYYVNNISLYEELLTTIIVLWPTQSLGNEADDQFLKASGGTPLQLHMLRIMMSLRINLEHKSILYEDSSMRYVFIMNNFNYILTNMKGCPQLEMIGNEYRSKLSEDILQAAQDYFSSIWHKVLYSLRHDGLNYKFPFFKGISKNSVKKRFKTFNTEFEKFCETQSTRFVKDTELRGQLCNLILNKFLTDYKSFLDKFGRHIQSERYKERYIKYSSEDLQNKIQSLFGAYLIAQ